MPSKLAIPLATLAALGAATPAAADTLLVPATGAQHLAGGGGYAAWSAPAGDGRFKLVVREPGGAVADAPISTFRAPVDPSIGSTRTAFPRSLVAVYSRCAGSTCAVWQYDLRTRRERRLAALGNATAPSVSYGSYAFVRRAQGTFVKPEGEPARRVDTASARETAITESRVVYLTPGDQIRWRSVFAGRVRTIGRAPRGRAFSLVATRYRIGWLQREGGRVAAKLSDRIEGGSASVRTGRRTLPASTTGASMNATNVDRYLDAGGLHRVTPNLFAP
ncbi:MAG: hypothetical protein JHC95_10995 [Solirubrobacteraceae bacterium]|nr:hypothetical protein [Solirubrobacteraceae bacterium]